MCIRDSPNGVPVHTLGSSNDSVQIAYWEKDNKVYMLYFATTRNQNFVSKIVDSVGPLTNVAADDTRLRGERNDKQHVEENDAQSVKQNGEQDRPHFETIGLPLRTHTNSEWPILTSKSIGLPSGVIDEMCIRDRFFPKGIFIVRVKHGVEGPKNNKPNWCEQEGNSRIFV